MKARIRDGALVGCDFHYCTWKDKGEVFEVEDFEHETGKRLRADGYGNKGDYGNGCLYVSEKDLIFVEDEVIMKCPHCDKEITEVDEIVNAALEAACSKPVEKVNYQIEKVGLAAHGTFAIDGETREFYMAFDDYRRLIRFHQEKKK